MPGEVAVGMSNNAGAADAMDVDAVAAPPTANHILTTSMLPTLTETSLLMNGKDSDRCVLLSSRCALTLPVVVVEMVEAEVKMVNVMQAARRQLQQRPLRRQLLKASNRPSFRKSLSVVLRTGEVSDVARTPPDTRMGLTSVNSCPSPRPSGCWRVPI